ncbi:MAG: ATP-binding cassette domain-containing protein [Ectothiorhodospiraceae bacterium]|nr:ATP-binding cassette domain-containing protein [Ectothiorhodospiraceae bacterium]
MLNLVNLSLRRGPRLLLSGITLTIHAGERVGVVGANGSGKSSLFSLLLGRLQPDAGEYSLPPRIVIAHVAQETPADSRPALDYVMDGDGELREVQQSLERAEAAGNGELIATLHGRLESIGGYDAHARAARLMHGLGFRPGQEHQPVSSLSGGWRMRLNLAQALMCRSDLLLLDEPTNHLDLDAVLWLQEWLSAYQGTLLLISHDRDFLDAVCGRILHLEGGGLQSYSGNYSAFQRQRLARMEQQQALHQRQLEERARLQQFIDRFRAKATKARQAQSRIKALERMDIVAPVQQDAQFGFRFQPPLKLPNPLLQLEDAAAGYGNTPVLEGLNLQLSPGDRIGLLGPNGAGKSTLVRTLAGVQPMLHGHRHVAQDLVIGYFAQHQLEQLDPAASPLLHLQRLDPRATDQQLRDFLGGFAFHGDAAVAEVAPLSGGEKARLALALLVYQRPNLLLLDEPTNHLDLDMRQALAMALQSFEGALVVIAHDRHLLRMTTDQLYLLADGRLDEFSGDLDDYARWLAGRRQQATTRAAPEEPAGDRVTAAERKEQRRQQAERRQALQPLRQSVQSLERRLERLGQRRTELEQQLAESDLYEEANRSALQALLQEQGQVLQELQQVEEQWMQAADALEQAENAVRE